MSPIDIAALWVGRIVIAFWVATISVVLLNLAWRDIAAWLTARRIARSGDVPPWIRDALAHPAPRAPDPVLDPLDRDLADIPVDQIIADHRKEQHP